MTKTKNKKRTKKMKINITDIKRNGFLGQSRKRVQVGVFACVFSLVGLVGLYLSQAATTNHRYTVQVVVLCGSDQSVAECGNSKHLSNVSTRVARAQKWYKNRLGDGRTFARTENSDGTLKAPLRIKSDFTVAQYRAGFVGSTTSDNDSYRTSDRLVTESALKYDSNTGKGPVRDVLHKKTIVVLGFNSMNHCAYTSYKDISIVDYKRGCGSYQDSVYAHELMHQWKDGAHSTDGTLMNKPDACNGKPLYSGSDVTKATCALNSNAADYKSFLLNSRSGWFPRQITATASDNDPLIDDMSDIPASSIGATDSGAPAAVAPVLLYKFYNEGIIDNLYSTNKFDGARSLGYSYQGCVASVMPSQVAGTIPLHRYFLSGSHGAFGGDTLYTGTRDDAGYSGYGYSYVGIAGYVFTSQQPGTVPFKQYFAGAPKTDHFYTAEAWTSGFLDYNYETNVGYVYPPPADHCGPTDPAPASPNKVVLHHYYNGNNIDNFYTLGRDDGFYANYGYGYQGCKAIVWDRQVPGSTPLHRYWNGVGGDHFYTITRNDAGYAGYGYGYETVEGYVFGSAGVGGTAAFNRYFAGAPKTDHYYTMDPWTNGFLGYYFENTEAYTYRCN